MLLGSVVRKKNMIRSIATRYEIGISLGRILAQFSFFTIPQCFAPWGVSLVRKTNMAAKEEDLRPTTSLKSFKDVSK